MLSSQSAYDVIVIGGGPAGATVSTLLQRQGHRCLILEKSHFPRYHVGESLIPDTFPTLERLGLLPAMRESAFPVKRSVRFVAPSGTESEPFFFSETIDGPRARTWQVERSEFDRLCLEHAATSGVEVRQGTRVKEVLFEDGRAVGVLAKGADGPLRIAAEVVVDASGAATKIGSQLGLRQPVPGLKKAAIWTYYCGARRSRGVNEGETLILTLPERGWFWYIPLPDDIVSVGIVADPDHLFAESRDLSQTFLRQVERCAPLSKRLRSARRTAPIRGLRELAYLNRQTSGTGWVMVGDARAFLDPVYSSGLFLALSSAEMAADCIHDALVADDISASRLGAFEPTLMAGVETVRRLIHAFYDPAFSFHEFVQRFPDQRPALVDCLVGDVYKDMSAFVDCLGQMTSPPLMPKTQQLVRT